MEEIEPLTVGGGAVEDASFVDYSLKSSYEKFENGTPNIAGEKIKSWEDRLVKRLIGGLQEMDKIEVYGYGGEAFELGKRIGTASFNVKGMNPNEVALRLDNEASIL